MALTKRTLRLLLSGAVAVAMLGATGVAHAAAPGTKTVTVTVSDVEDNPQASSWGRVTSTPAGIDCPGDCSEDFATGSTVSLAAAPRTGYVFGGWGVFDNDSTCDVGPVCTITVANGPAAQVDASFAPQASLLVQPQGAGVVTISPPEDGRPAAPCLELPDPACAPRYPRGTRVTLTAVPDASVPGARFVRWSDYRCPAAGRSCTLTVDGETPLTAVFEPVHLTVMEGRFGPVFVAPPGVVCTFAPDALTGDAAPCRFAYPLNTLVSVTRDPALATGVGASDMWTGACGGVAITCRVRMRRDVVLRAGAPPLAQTGPGQSMRFGYAGPKGGRIIVDGGDGVRTCRKTCVLGGFQPDSRVQIRVAGSRSVAFAKWSDIRVRAVSRSIFVGDPTAVRATFKKKRRR
jgi:hypothetical protein